MVWLIVFCIILVIIVGMFAYTTYNLLQKVERYEDFISEIHAEYISVLKQIRHIDLRGSFESDDEVGLIYSAIRTTILKLRDFLGIEETE